MHTGKTTGAKLPERTIECFGSNTSFRRDSSKLFHRDVRRRSRIQLDSASKNAMRFVLRNKVARLRIVEWHRHLGFCGCVKLTHVPSAIQYWQIHAPGPNCLAILLRHHARRLRHMSEIVHHPR